MSMILENILGTANVLIKRNTQRANEVTICCIFCGDTRFRLGINLDTGYAHCWNCGFASRSLLHTAHELCNAFGVKYNFTGIRRERRMEHKVIADQASATPIALPEEYERFGSGTDSVERRAMAYLHSRQVSLLQIHHHKVGFAATGPYAWRIIFPVMDTKQACYGFCTRDFSGLQKSPYLNSSGLKLLWGCHRLGTSVVLVEGVMDALRTEKALLGLPNTIAAAKLGSGITDLQIQQLREYEQVILLPDWDVPGVTGMISVANKCVDHRIATKICIPEVMDRRDPGGMDESELLSIIVAAVPWSKNAEYRMRLAATKRQTGYSVSR